MTLLEQVISSSQTATAKVRQRSALNPALWLCGVITLPSWAIASFAPLLRVLLFYTGCAPVALVIGAYIYFMIRDPDRLQTEEFVIRKTALGLIHQKDGAAPISPESIELITNPATLRLPDGK